MNTQDNNDTDNLFVEGSIVETKKTTIKNVAKKALIWGGAAVGLIAVTLIASNTRRTADVLEENILVLEETPVAEVEIEPEITD